MSGLLTRYVMRAVIVGALLVLAVLVALDTMFAFFGELDELGRGDYDVLTAVTYMVLTIPGRLYELFPVAVAIGGVMGLGTLAANSEIVVMRAAGISKAHIMGMVMLGGLVLMGALVATGEGVAPGAQQSAERLRAAAIAGQSRMRGAEGLWVRDEQRFINVGEVLPGYVLRDVDVYEFAGRRLERALHAESARFVDGGWDVQGIRSTHLDDGELRTERREIERWERLVRPELFQLLAVSPDSLPIWRLGDYVAYLEQNRLEAARFQLAFWRKIATPLSTLVMLLLALPVVFGSLRSTGAGQRIFLGSLVGVAYYLVAELFAHIGIVYGLAAPVAALAPPVCFAVVGAVILRRIA